MDAAQGHLYPPIEPFDYVRLQVSRIHNLYIERCGTPDGIPVVVLHGGPGGGCSPAMRRFFDPRHFQVILFDQRGSGRSRPSASLEENTTHDLIEDIERIREHLNIERWIVFGGSWGATLGLLYAQKHPERVRALVLRGVFLLQAAEVDWFYNGGAGHWWPDLYERFCEPIPIEERDDLIAAYHARLTSRSIETQIRHARPWSRWEGATAAYRTDPARMFCFEDDAQARAFARIENHYFLNQGFLSAEEAILDNCERLAQIPGVVVQGRYDMICPPRSAYELCKRWDKGRLVMVDRAGHALSEPRITQMLVSEMEAIARGEWG
ncbi:MAG: prolyl aminopeptidase [Neomegalonema sp.]|nr:prolyl aminopeptidase [Neomegalonema sp.]